MWVKNQDVFLRKLGGQELHVGHCVLLRVRGKHRTEHSNALHGISFQVQVHSRPLNMLKPEDQEVLWEGSPKASQALGHH